MSEFLIVKCSHCGASYRLPSGSEGKKARCTRCRQTFRILAEPDLDDTVLDWLAGDANEDSTVVHVAPPRVVTLEQAVTADHRAGPRRSRARLGGENG